MGNKYEIIQNRLSKYGYKIVNINEYVDVNHKIIFEDIDGYKYRTTISQIFRGFTPNKFGKSNPYTIENINKWIIQNDKHFSLLSNEFTYNQCPILWFCKICNKTFKMSFSHILGGEGCRHCKYIKQGLINMKPKDGKSYLHITNPELRKEWNDKEYNFDDMASKSSIKINWKCSKCGHEWKTNIYHRTYNNSGCPKCTKSKGENKIEEWLVQNEIRYIPQFRFDDCKNKQSLPFDFYLTDKNICIEYQGLQHYQPIDFSNFSTDSPKAKEQYEYIKLNDSIKKQYCIDNHIKLLEISYKKLNKIFEVLEQEIN